MIAENNLYNYKARAYDPKLGRFLQIDPVGVVGGMNAYAYAGNDPVNSFDPSGTANEQPNRCLGCTFESLSLSSSGCITEWTECATGSDAVELVVNGCRTLHSGGASGGDFGVGGFGGDGGIGGGGGRVDSNPPQRAPPGQCVQPPSGAHSGGACPANKPLTCVVSLPQNPLTGRILRLTRIQEDQLPRAPTLTAARTILHTISAAHTGRVASGIDINVGMTTANNVHLWHPPAAMCLLERGSLHHLRVRCPTTLGRST
jgi:hypothetical protein